MCLFYQDGGKSYKGENFSRSKYAQNEVSDIATSSEVYEQSGKEECLAHISFNFVHYVLLRKLYNSWIY
jgi:hypothetical protein